MPRVRNTEWPTAGSEAWGEERGGDHVRSQEEEEEAARERPISRRHVLGNVARAGAVGAGAAVLVGVGVEPALAGSDGDVVLGAPNTASAVTRITNASGTAFTGSGSVNGVEGNSSSGIASGVIGQNDSGGLGVVGRAADGIGVSGESTNGTGVLATSFFGRALDVSGAAGFSRSGVKSIAFPNKSATVSVPGGLSVFCPCARHRPGHHGRLREVCGAQRRSRNDPDQPEQGTWHQHESKDGEGGLVRRQLAIGAAADWSQTWAASPRFRRPTTQT